MTHTIISAETLILAFGKSAKLDTQAISLINLLGMDRNLAAHVNRLLLEHGDALCPNMNEELFLAMTTSLEQSIGLGKGIFMSTLIHMPERFARIRLSLWLKSDGLLDFITTHFRQAVLSSSMQNQRYSLANDMAHWMESLGESASVQMSLSRFDRKTLSQANLCEHLPESSHVDILCRSKAYMQALSTASDELNIAIVRRAIAKELGAQDSSWKALLQKLCQNLSNDEYDTTTVVSRYKAVGTVLLNYLQNMDEETRKSNLCDDDIRVMAFKLGIESVIGEMKSHSHKKAAVLHGLSL